MKNILSGFLFLTVLLFAGSCAMSDPGYVNKPNNYSNYSNLAEALRSVGGIRITGGNTIVGAENVQVFLRGGSSSIVLNTQPLYIVNNIPVGNSYSDANSIVNMREVTSIRIITGTHAVTVYGERGNHGVILIKMKEAADIK